MKHVLMIGAPYDRPTDGMINKGIEYLLEESGVDPQDIHYEPFVDAPTDQLTLATSPTHIIVCGGPFLWDGMQYSQKFKNVVSLRYRYPQAKIMFCGIGACFPLGKEEEVLARLRLARPKLAPLFDGATIIARDAITANFLQAEWQPCPAYYAPRVFHSNIFDERLGSFPLAVWYDPRTGISASEWQDSNKFNNYVQIYKDFLTKYPTADILAINQEEMASGEQIFGQNISLATRVFTAYQFLEAATIVLSGRVHLAIPAHAMGKPVTLIPVDTRHEAFDEKLTPNDLEKSKEEYVQIFKEFLK